ncbi:MAG: hypothetical protein HWD86_06015 [Kangiellaceae bacterium]|nr:hypothetical protein [Kangiellaceae bacterium]
MKKILLITLSIVLFAIFIKARQPVVLGAGVKAKEEPVQTAIDEPNPFDFKGYVMTPLADFDIKAKVIRREDYRFDKGADISPMDLALGWGRMSDEAVLEHLDVSQSGRWYRYRYQNAPIPQQEIQTHSANMHLIPANSYVEKQINKVKAGQIIQIIGQLVKVEDQEQNWRWQSSLTRKDTGDGACELIFVEQLMVIEG